MSRDKIGAVLIAICALVAIGIAIALKSGWGMGKDDFDGLDADPFPVSALSLQAGWIVRPQKMRLGVTGQAFSVSGVVHSVGQREGVGDTLFLKLKSISGDGRVRVSLGSAHREWLMSLKPEQEIVIPRVELLEASDEYGIVALKLSRKENATGFVRGLLPNDSPRVGRITYVGKVKLYHDAAIEREKYQSYQPKGPMDVLVLDRVDGAAFVISDSLGKGGWYPASQVEIKGRFKP